MFIDFKTEKLNQCECGHKPDHYGMGYGRTPYAVQCKCGKTTNRYRSIGGHSDNIIDFWNQIAPLKELENLTWQVGKMKFNYKDKFDMRRYILDNYKLKIYILFENGRILEPDSNQFLWKGIDY